MAAQLSAHAKRNSVGISADHSGAHWSEASHSGKRIHASAVGHVQARGEASEVEPVGSTVLDWADDDLERLAIRSRDRATGNSDRVATPTFQTILVEVVSAKRTRATAREFGDSATGQNDGCRQPTLGRTSHTRRTLKLGFEISQRTVSRLMPKRDKKPSQTWKTFLHNHVGQLVSVDFFTVATIQLRVLYVFVVLAHDRRRVLHLNVTEHPTAIWAAQQVVEAFPEDSVPRYLVRARGGIYG